MARRPPRDLHERAGEVNANVEIQRPRHPTGLLRPRGRTLRPHAADLAALPFDEDDWLAENIHDHVEHELTLSSLTAQEAYRTPADHPALADAVLHGFGAPAGRMGNAGGGPAELLCRTLDAAVVFFGTGLPEDRWHDTSYWPEPPHWHTCGPGSENSRATNGSDVRAVFRRIRG